MATTIHEEIRQKKSTLQEVKLTEAETWLKNKWLSKTR